MKDPNPDVPCFMESPVEIVCVNEKYESDTFCGIKVGRSPSSCAAFAEENLCYKAMYYFEKDWVVEPRFVAPESGCVSTSCENETGKVRTKSLCT